MTSAWTPDELDRIGAAEEVEIAPRRADGTLRSAVPIWVVRVGDELYVRSWRGLGGVTILKPFPCSSESQCFHRADG